MTESCLGNPDSCEGLSEAQGKVIRADRTIHRWKQNYGYRKENELAAAIAGD
jgi:hypothetical protein